MAGKAMDAEEVFEMVERQLLDCPRNRLRIFCHASGQEYRVIECYESNWELHLTIEPKEESK